MSITTFITTEMLTRLDNKTVRGPNFLVSVPDIHHVVYAEGEKVAHVEIEGGAERGAPINWVIYSETLTGWRRPHIGVVMSESERTQILANISKSLDLLAMPNRIV